MYFSKWRGVRRLPLRDPLGRAARGDACTQHGASRRPHWPAPSLRESQQACVTCVNAGAKRPPCGATPVPTDPAPRAALTVPCHCPPSHRSHAFHTLFTAQRGRVGSTVRPGWKVVACGVLETPICSALRSAGFSDFRFPTSCSTQGSTDKKDC